MNPITGLAMAVLASSATTEQDRKEINGLVWMWIGFSIITAPWFWWLTLGVTCIFLMLCALALFMGAVNWILNKIGSLFCGGGPVSDTVEQQQLQDGFIREQLQRNTAMQQQLENELVRERNERLGYK